MSWVSFSGFSAGAVFFAVLGAAIGDARFVADSPPAVNYANLEVFIPIFQYPLEYIFFEHRIPEVQEVPPMSKPSHRVTSRSRSAPEELEPSRAPLPPASPARHAVRFDDQDDTRTWLAAVR